jgi:hypothetical protein
VTFLYVLILILGLGYVALERRWTRNSLVLCAKLYSVPAILVLLLVAPMALETSGPWITGEAFARLVVTTLCVGYLVMVALTASLHGLAQKMTPSRNGSVFVTIFLLFGVLLSAALALKQH